MPLSKEIIGKKLSSYEFAVDKAKVLEFCMAIGETNPLFLDRDFAQKAGHEDTLVPPTFPTVFTFWGCPTLMQDIRLLGIDTDRLLHMKENYQYIKAIHPGMLIHSDIEVKDVKMGKMDMVSFASTYRNPRQEICVQAKMVIILRPEKK